MKTTTSNALRFPISFSGLYRWVSNFLLLSTGDSYLEIDGSTVHCRMGWAFRCAFPKAAVASVAEADDAPMSRGVHGFAGRWLVNGSGQGILTITLEPIQRAYVMGFPVRLQQLMVSVEDPRSLMSALTGSD